MASLNRITLIGNLGKNPELHSTTTGKKVSAFTLATSERWGEGEGREARDFTEWHDVEVWGAQAQAVKDHLRTGRQVYVEGQVRTDRWQDKETGEQRSRKKVVASRVVFLGSAAAKGAPTQAEES